MVYVKFDQVNLCRKSMNYLLWVCSFSVNICSVVKPLNSKKSHIIWKFGDKSDFTIARFYCTQCMTLYSLQCFCEGKPSSKFRLSIGPWLHYFGQEPIESLNWELGLSGGLVGSSARFWPILAQRGCRGLYPGLFSGPFRLDYSKRGAHFGWFFITI